MLQPFSINAVHKISIAPDHDIDLHDLPPAVTFLPLGFEHILLFENKGIGHKYSKLTTPSPIHFHLCYN